MATKKAKTDETATATTTTTAETSAPEASGTAAAASTPPAGGQMVLLSQAAQKELFMHDTSHRVYGKCARTGQITDCGQYPRSELRLDHLAKDDRDRFNAELDAIAIAEEAEAKVKAASDEAAVKRAEEAKAAAEAAIDTAYEKAVADRKAIEAKEAAGSSTSTSTSTPAAAAKPVA